MSTTETLDPILPPDLSQQARAVLALACDREMPLITAESCTGGLLAALLTDVPGRSHIFERGFVVYSDDAKCDLLAVDRAQIERCGAVSREVAVAMARGALDRSGNGVGVAITGFAGPGGESDEEGLVHFACGRFDGPVAHREEHFGAIGRDGVRIAALAVALDMMDNALRA
ncbi:CinA family protein [Pelagerythrobacter marensis]|uniref:CinA family protein n=1 Tax=Pelagerythrobacter marensis TaxID=543877 RepID=A0ABZ2D6Z1_9SPHN